MRETIVNEATSKGNRPPSVDMEEPVRSIINDCINYKVKSIEGLRSKYEVTNKIK